MRNPLTKRLPRELKSEFGKNFVLFLFLAGVIALVSGFLVANDSMVKSYKESFHKYNIEDGNFELALKADSKLINSIEDKKVNIYENFYIEEDTKNVDSTLRIFKNRTNIDKVCLMNGKLPSKSTEIAIDRMYADNNKLSVEDFLTVGDKELKITGLVALSDYSALFQNTSDMMFDATRFGVAIMTDDGFDSYKKANIHYSYSWKYNNSPVNNTEAKDKADTFLKSLNKYAAKSGNVIENYIPEYTNQAIIFTGDDMTGDNTMVVVFLYIVIIIVSFIFAITTNNTIAKEAGVIGTLRASGYSRGELVRHYMTLPLITMFIAAIAGNVVGYTYIKVLMVDMYYGSYSLPTYVTLWNADAFVRTTIIPIVIMTIIVLTVLSIKLRISPLQFLRHELSKKSKKKAFKLNTKIKIMKRFKLRVLFQNMPNYVTILIGIFFANFIFLFGMCLEPLLDHYQNEITNNTICNYQYILKAPVKTNAKDVEKYNVKSLKTVDNKMKSEDVTCYGIADNSKYISIDFSNDSVYISDAYANKFSLSKGDKFSIKEAYGDKKYTVKVGGDILLSSRNSSIYE